MCLVRLETLSANTPGERFARLFIPVILRKTVPAANLFVLTVYPHGNLPTSLHPGMIQNTFALSRPRLPHSPAAQSNRFLANRRGIDISSPPQHASPRRSAKNTLLYVTVSADDIRVDPFPSRGGYYWFSGIPLAVSAVSGIVPV